MLQFGKAPFLECSSKGDKRFSAFYAKVGSKTIENRYQAYKSFDGRTGLTIAEAKGREPDNADQARKYYSVLWQIYVLDNPELTPIIEAASGFSDVFGQEGHACQAQELFRIKNQLLLGEIPDPRQLTKAQVYERGRQLMKELSS